MFVHSIIFRKLASKHAQAFYTGLSDIAGLEVLIGSAVPLQLRSVDPHSHVLLAEELRLAEPGSGRDCAPQWRTSLPLLQHDRRLHDHGVRVPAPHLSGLRGAGQHLLDWASDFWRGWRKQEEQGCVAADQGRRNFLQGYSWLWTHPGTRLLPRTLPVHSGGYRNLNNEPDINMCAVWSSNKSMHNGASREIGRGDVGASSTASRPTWGCARPWWRGSWPVAVRLTLNSPSTGS